MISYSRALPVDSSKVRSHRRSVHPFDAQIHFVLEGKSQIRNVLVRQAPPNSSITPSPGRNHASAEPPTKLSGITVSAKAEARFPSGGNKKHKTKRKKKARLSTFQSKLFFLKGRFIGASEFQFPPPPPHI